MTIVKRGKAAGKKVRRTRSGEPGSTTKVKKRRARNPEATLNDILRATIFCLATGGPDGVSLLRVAQIACVNRSTAYEYFHTREQLIAKAVEWASNQLLAAVFGGILVPGETPIENVDKILRQRRAGNVVQHNERLTNFAMENPDLCRVWLMQVLTLPNPAKDPFWKAWQGSTSHFAKTKFSQDNIDADVYTVITLAGAFLWPLWAHAHATSSNELGVQAHRYVRECIRLALYGSFRPEHFPELVETFKAQ